MKKLFLVSLMMLAGSAWAEWVMYDTGGITTFYYDPATIRKDGNMRRVWQLQDLKERLKDGVISRRLRHEYDCKQERYRFLAISAHTESMAGGVPLRMEGEDNNWIAIAPDTTAEIIFNLVCTK